MTMGQVTNGTTKMGLKVVNPSKRTLQRKAKAAKQAAEVVLPKAFNTAVKAARKLEWKRRGKKVVLTADGKDVGTVAQVGDMAAAAKLATDKLLGRAHPVKKQLSERTLRHHRKLARDKAAVEVIGSALTDFEKQYPPLNTSLNFGQVTSGPETRIAGGSFDFSHQMVDPDVLALNSLTETLGARGVMQLIRRSVA